MAGKDPTCGQTRLMSDETRATGMASNLRRSLSGQASLLLHGRRGVQIVPLTEGRTQVVGRYPPADVIVRDASLSRRHASIELRAGEVWLRDLGSSNGTWVDQRRIDRMRIEPGSEILLGGVRATVQLLSPLESRRHGFFDHDLFARELDAEVDRSSTHSRPLALLMLQQTSGRPLGPWLSPILQRLRPFDRVALYSADTAEVLLPEADEARATLIAEQLVGLGDGLVCGVVTLPAHASSADELLDVARGALQSASPAQPVARARPAAARVTAAGATSEHGEVIIADEAMRALFERAERVASTTIPVLLLGETGTGKERLAETMHHAGKRKGAPMACVNCGAIPEGLVESTLFGHEKGAFTGATRQAEGVFESANGGTVFLDEIGDLPLPAQAALLRVLENGTFQRVGSTKVHQTDVRVVSATHRDLAAMCGEGQFREDLYYRLNAMSLEVPPLRERTDDIEPLVHHFIDLANRANELDVTGIEADALELLRRYPWPGNVRELRNAVEHAVVICDTERIGIEDLPATVLETAHHVPATTVVPTGSRPDTEADEDVGFDLKEQVASYEAQLVRQALDPGLTVAPT